MIFFILLLAVAAVITVLAPLFSEAPNLPIRFAAEREHLQRLMHTANLSNEMKANADRPGSIKPSSVKQQLREQFNLEIDELEDEA
ncbi:MAG TPA: hypothetical protein PKW76_04780 [bacterium]|nr:hypothetical protein [bacterium]HPG44975.1 hypothetical protein [bacterium]HPM97217.1 hypothetical protein [bacterium]